MSFPLSAVAGLWPNPDVLQSFIAAAKARTMTDWWAADRSVVCIPASEILGLTQLSSVVLQHGALTLGLSTSWRKLLLRR